VTLTHITERGCPQPHLPPGALSFDRRLSEQPIRQHVYTPGECDRRRPTGLRRKPRSGIPPPATARVRPNPRKARMVSRLAKRECVTPVINCELQTTLSGPQRQPAGCTHVPASTMVPAVKYGDVSAVGRWAIERIRRYTELPGR